MGELPAGPLVWALVPVLRAVLALAALWALGRLLGQATQQWSRTERRQDAQPAAPRSCWPDAPPDTSRLRLGPALPLGPTLCLVEQHLQRLAQHLDCFAHPPRGRALPLGAVSSSSSPSSCDLCWGAASAAGEPPAGRLPLPKPRGAGHGGCRARRPPGLDCHVRRKQLRAPWGGPTPLSESLTRLVPGAPPLCPPGSTGAARIGTCRLPFLPHGAQAALDWHPLRQCPQRGPHGAATRPAQEPCSCPPGPLAPGPLPPGEVLAAQDHVPTEENLLGADHGPTPDPCTCPQEDARPGRLPPHRAAALQLHVTRKCLEIRAGALPAAVRASRDAAHRGPPALPKPLRQGLAPETARRLEVHVRRKQRLRRWGLAALPARSLASLVPRAPCLAAPPHPWVPRAAFSECDTPFLAARARAALDWHVLGTRLQHCWGLPALLQRSLAAWRPPAPRPSPPRPRGAVAVAVAPQALPFLGRGARELLEAHLTAQQAQHRWRLPARVQASLRSFAPPAPSLVPPLAGHNRSPGLASCGPAEGHLAHSEAGSPGHEPARQPRSRTSTQKRSRSWTPDWKRSRSRTPSQKRSRSRTPSQKRSRSRTPSQEAPSKLPSPSHGPLRQASDNVIPRTGPQHAAGLVQFKTTGSPGHAPPSQPRAQTPECTGRGSPRAQTPELVGPSQPRARTPELVGPSQPRARTPELVGPSQPRAQTPKRTRPGSPRAQTPELVGPSQPRAQTPKRTRPGSPRAQTPELVGPSQPRAQTPECTGPSQPHTWSLDNTRPQSQSPEHVLATRLCDLTLEYVAPSQPQAWTPEYPRPRSQTPEYVAPSQPCSRLPESPAPSQPHGLASDYVMPQSQTADHPLPPQPCGLVLAHTTTSQPRARTPAYAAPSQPRAPAPAGERSRSPRALRRSPPGPAPDVCWSVTTTHEALAALYWREPPGTPPPAAPGSPPAAAAAAPPGPAALAQAIVGSLGARRAVRDLRRRLSGPARPRVEYPVCLPCARCYPDGPCPRHPPPRGRRGPRLIVYPRLRAGPGPRLRLGFVLRLKRKQAAQWDLLPAAAPRPREPPPAAAGQPPGAAPGPPRPPATARVPRSAAAPRGPASRAPAFPLAAKPPRAGRPVPAEGHPLPKRLLASVRQAWAWARGGKPGPQPPPRGPAGSWPSPAGAPRPIRSH